MTQRPSEAEDLALWSRVDAYYEGLLGASDPALTEALRSSAAAGLPAIQVSPLQGKLLHLLARTAGARRILEIGTLGGYSAIWLARALPPGGRLVSLELDPKHAEVARANLARAGLADRVEVRLGPAAESLRRLAAERAEPFDLVFIDADKQGYPEYLEGALRLAKVGTVLVADNVVRRGDVADPGHDDPQVTGVRAMHERLQRTPGVRATVIQTVGAKGYDGFTLARVENLPA
ncbi:MAG TPA: O-methyltransferase [Thermoplasmata archaeon]|nr:O-methyltransferase [Thermoplasmata archaeon]